jgi:hypothetical protein
MYKCWHSFCYTPAEDGGLNGGGVFDVEPNPVFKRTLFQLTTKHLLARKRKEFRVPDKKNTNTS